MEPLNFEDLIRKQLQEREMTPSKKAWTKLEMQLEPTILKKKKIDWMTLAAFFTGVLLIAAFLFNKDLTTIHNATVEIENMDKSIKIEEGNSRIVLINPIENEECKDKEEQLKLQINKTNEVNIKKSVVAITTKSSSLTIKSSKITKEEKPVIAMQTENTEENIAVSNVDIINLPYDEDDIDALLIKAQNKLESSSYTNHKKVDAAALLEVVETEIETTFRDKIFEAIGKGYQKVRTAVVEDNN